MRNPAENPCERAVDVGKDVEEKKLDFEYLENFINNKPTLATIIKAYTFSEETAQQLWFMKIFDQYDIKQDKAESLMKHLRTKFFR